MGSIIKFEEHMRKYGIAVKENEVAVELKKEGDIVSLKTSKDKYVTKTVMIASGKRSRKLGVPGEEEFKNKGLTYCATCDGPLFADKDVAVIGGGNSALDATLQSIRIAKKVYLINIASQLTGDAIMQEKIHASKKVTIFNNTQVTAIRGDKMVGGIKVKSGGKEKTLAVQGIFVEIGLIPNSEFAAGVEKNKLGEIKVNCRNETDIPGILAAGDVTDVPEKQIIVAAGEGAKAALGAFRHLMQSR